MAAAWHCFRPSTMTFRPTVRTGLDEETPDGEQAWWTPVYGELERRPTKKRVPPVDFSNPRRARRSSAGPCLGCWPGSERVGALRERPLRPMKVGPIRFSRVERIVAARWWPAAGDCVVSFEGDSASLLDICSLRPERVTGELQSAIVLHV